MKVSDEIQIKIVAGKAKEIGLLDDKQITYPVVMRTGINGKTIRYYLNYSGKDQSELEAW